MRVWHTESSLGWGGQENRTLMELEYLHGRGIEVAVVTPPGARLAARAQEKGLPVHSVPMGRGLALDSLLALRRLFARHRPSHINTHSGRDTLLAGLAARSLWKRPHIVRTRHLILPPTHLATYTWLPDRVVTVSQAVADDLAQRGVPRARLRVVPTGVDLKRFDPAQVTPTLRQALGLAPDVLLVGTLAILRNKKGHRDLLAAIPRVLARLPQVHFVIAGDGPQEAKLKAEAANLGLSAHVHFLGLRRDVPEILRALDLFVLPTREEALGTAFLEAQAMGVPVIGTRVGGVPETIREGETGLLVPPHDPERLAAALLELLENPGKRAAFARAARPWVAAHFGIEQMGAGMLAVYEELEKSQ
ncbi:glycosyltransferase [Thiobacter aerophilum]|uniref:Glycosyltransferase n=1 Tax=Thiobacter aerophilum TaxID=3121275 RepID=A0ABV0ECL4_9BURK